MKELNRNILIVSCVFPPEPVVSANLSYDIADSLSEKHNVTVLSPLPTRPYGIQINNLNAMKNEFRHITLDSFVCPQSKIIGRFKESWSFGRKTASYIKANYEKIDVIYANTWPLFAQYFLVRIAIKYNIPLVLHVQDIYPDSFVKKLPKILGEIVYQILLPIDKYILHKSSKIVGISPYMISHLSKSRNISISKFQLIRNWQNDSIFNTTFDVSKNSLFTFMYLGSISPSAGLDIIIKAFSKASLQDSVLRIVGSGSKKEDCINLAKELNCKNIIFEEALPEDVPMLQSQADVLLLPLLKGISKTASPSKMTAYFLSGKPIIACVENDSDTADCIQQAQCGFIIEPEDISSLIDGFRQACSLTHDERIQMGENAKRFAKSSLSRSINLNRITEIIEKQQ